ncbi:stress responsive alpha-beta barrel [Sporolactobacillus inulinus]|uniref:Stress responsive alpha-beta barrel n=1 Tax=Sporolactobacillus inulinus TaxID=2078 RepID=A0A4Y1ZD69_9BACL|nr:Dabb family protein [Sporolactobacillus inulinus]GAY77042.1 stress responsive alpha-beta barrel [Sporolactobacillus inulinus]
MIEHIVLFKFRDETTKAQIEEGARKLRSLKQKLPYILDIQAGLNYSTRGKGYAMALTVRLSSKADHERYTPSTEHQACVSYLKEIGLVDSLAMDFEIAE